MASSFRPISISASASFRTVHLLTPLRQRLQQLSLDAGPRQNARHVLWLHDLRCRRECLEILLGLERIRQDEIHGYLVLDDGGTGSRIVIVVSAFQRETE